MSALGQCLCRAAQVGAVGDVRRLLDNGANMEERSATGARPLHWAALLGHNEVAWLLLKAGADKEAQCNEGGTPLHYAADKGMLEVVRTLVTFGANVEAQAGDGTQPSPLTR
jgi:ankyrin repeat protein